MIYSKKVKLHESKKLGSPTAKIEEQDFFHLSPLAPHTQRYSVHNHTARRQSDTSDTSGGRFKHYKYNIEVI